MRIFHIAKKEVIQTFRDRRMIGILFIAPIFQLIAFSYAVTYDVKRIPAAILDYDNSSHSRQLTDKLSASGYFYVGYNPNNYDELTKLIDRGEVWCSIIIPADFQKSLKRNDAIDIQAIFDGTNSNSASISASYLIKIIQDYTEDISSESQPRVITQIDSGIVGTVSSPIIDSEIRAWYNPNLLSRIYNVPAVLVQIMLVITMVLTSMAVVKEKELGTIEQISVTPISPVELMIGKTLPFIVIGVIDILTIMTVAIFWFKIPFLGSIWFLLLSSFVFMLTTLGTGLLISTFSSTQQQAMMTTTLLIMPFMILSGFAFPIANMPAEIQYITLINPVRYFVEISRSIFLKGSGFTELRDQLLALLAIGIFVMSLSIMRFRKRAN